MDGVERCLDDEIPLDIPPAWSWCRLGVILTKLTDGTHSTPKYQINGIPFLSVKDVSGGSLSFSSCKFISESEHRELYNRCNPEIGDLLLTKVGTTGIPAIVDTEREFSLFVSPETVNERNNLEKEIKKRNLIGEEKKAFVKIRINCKFRSDGTLFPLTAAWSFRSERHEFPLLTA